jgi:hypothetical protein
MTEKLRLKIAAVVTALFLGAVSTAGVLTHASTPALSAGSSVKAVTPAQTVTPGQPGPIPSSNREHENHD